MTTFSAGTPVWSDEQEIAKLRQQLAESKEEYGRACHLVAQMHFAATGEVTGPKLGVVEDVAEVRRKLAEAQQQAELGKAFTGQFFMDVERLEQQLAERDATIKLLRDAILQNRAAKSDWDLLQSGATFKKVLAATEPKP